MDSLLKRLKDTRGVNTLPTPSCQAKLLILFAGVYSIHPKGVQLITKLFQKQKLLTL